MENRQQGIFLSLLAGTLPEGMPVTGWKKVAGERYHPEKVKNKVRNPPVGRAGRSLMLTHSTGREAWRKARSAAPHGENE